MAYCQQRDDEVFSQGTCQKNVNSELYDKWDHVRSTISNWMWSWSDDRCKTEEEFNLSKALFLNYIKSAEVQEALGEDGAMQLQDIRTPSDVTFT
jgi:hypothetical protein